MRLYSHVQNDPTPRDASYLGSPNGWQIANRLATAIALSLLFSPAGFAQCGPTTVVVEHTGSQSTSCQNIIDALDSITCASPEQRYVVKLSPGKYSCNDKLIEMKDYVDLEGSGVESTLLSGKGDYDAASDRWVFIKAANFSEIRDFDILMRPPAGESDDAVAILGDDVSVRINNMNIKVRDHGKDCWGVLAQSLGSETQPYLKASYIDVTKCDNGVGVEFRGNVRPTLLRIYTMGTNSRVSSTGMLFNLFGLTRSSGGLKLWDVQSSAYGGGEFPGAECYAFKFENGSEPVPGIATFYQSLFIAELCDGGNTGLALGDNNRTILVNSRVWARFSGKQAENVGIEMGGGTLKANSSMVVGTTRSLNATGGAVAEFGASQVAKGSPQLTLGAKAVCVHSYNTDFEPLNSLCLPQ